MLQTHVHHLQKNTNILYTETRRGLRLRKTRYLDSSALHDALCSVAYLRWLEWICSSSAVQRADHHPVVHGGAPGPDGGLRPIGDFGFPAEPPPAVCLGGGSCGGRRVERAGRGGRDGGAVGLGARRGVDGQRRRAGDGDAARHRRRRRRRWRGGGRGGSGGREGRRRGGGGGGGENRAIVIRPAPKALNCSRQPTQALLLSSLLPSSGPPSSLTRRDVTPRAYVQHAHAGPSPNQSHRQTRPSGLVRGRMGLLDQLWDETVAGPRPDSGLGRLRKYSSFSPSSSSSSSFPAPAPAAAAAAPAPAPAPAVTRSITIARPPSLSVDVSPRAESYSSSVPSSPASTLDSPFATATTPKTDGWRRFRRKTKVSDGPEPAVGPRSPTVYDWVVISSLDR